MRNQNLGVKYLSSSAGFEHHLAKATAQKGRRKKILLASLMLTPMVDMFSLIVIFLLQSYSATGELFFMNKHIQLPQAIFGKAVDQSVLVAISPKEVAIDEDVLGPLSEVLKRPEQFVLKVRPYLHQEGRVNLQADKNMPSTQISYFMGLLQQAGFHDFRVTTSPGMEHAL